MGPFTHQPGRVTVAVQQLADDMNDVWLKQPASPHQLVRMDLKMMVHCAQCHYLAGCTALYLIWQVETRQAPPSTAMYIFRCMYSDVCIQSWLVELRVLIC